MDVIYLVRNNDGSTDDGGDVIYTTADANKAVAKSIELIKDQYGHVVEVWINGKKSGNIDLVL